MTVTAALGSPGIDPGVAVLVAVLLVVARVPWWRTRSTGRASGRPWEPGVGRSVPWPAVRGCRGRAATSVGTRPAPSAPLDPAVLLDLCAAALRGGVDVPGALLATGRHLGGDEGAALVRAGTGLGIGAEWDVAWAGAPPSVGAVGDALRIGWQAGASPAAQLRAAAVRVRRERRGRARAAAGALGVRLTLPLGVCFLPAFVLLGLVPVVLGLAGDLATP